MFTLFLFACGLYVQQSSSSAFKADVSLVHVDAEVSDRNKRVITGLRESDFRILDNGKPVPIAQFFQEEQPLDLIILFDISRSMRGAVQRVASATEAGVRELRDGDRVSIRVFNTESRTVLPFTRDLQQVEAAIRRVAGSRFDGGTLIQKAVDEAALSFKPEDDKPRRRAVLIITDNQGVRTRREETVVNDFWRADAILSGLIIRDPGFQTAQTAIKVINPAVILVEAGMKGIAEKTGGDVIQDKDAENGLREAMKRIRIRYSLYYRMPASAKPGEHRKIEIQLESEALKRTPGARINARQGYRVPAGLSH